MTEFICNSLNDTKIAAEYFSQFAEVGQCFALFGDLGYGKTTFSKYFIQSLNKSIKEVPSPTFAIVQIYNSSVAEIWHVDLYRLKSEEEFYELGVEEALHHCVTIVEWPEIIQHLLPQNVIKIRILLEGNARRIISEGG
ncbi:MAG: tRNA (adenosine(37)-N6)-threonylcarbamoyltransferase complex ATPase subunit type 1 TsaE [Holosporaceae bacterium]|jgi:tRNA threonylcarbamoyladenosine biosynthesis protein TsaE|nr:tRNA (adenosine(37)-N6)-threonylcarbamoyltransferase complex ATPase subunit type 1 TsaE [Holosporaceae bacterium]